MISSSDTVMVTAQVGTIIPPIMGGGGISFGYYPPVYPEIVFECSDGIDNDSDGLIDWGRDPNCLSNLGVSETEYVFENPYFPVITDPSVPPVGEDVIEYPDTELGSVSTDNPYYQWPLHLDTAATTPYPWSLPMPENIVLYPILGLLVFLYNIKPKGREATLLQWVLLVAGAFPITAAVLLYPSLYTISLGVIFAGFAVLRHVTRWW